MSHKLKVIPLSLGQIIAAGAFTALAAAPVFAQQSDSPASVQRVEITGSNILRADKETPSPVQVISSDDLKKSGYTTVSQVLQNITANGQGTLSTGFSGAFAGGASGISLRGLNTSATLVLIDGHRMAPYPLADDNQRSFVDIQSIPFDAVDRIEVLKDGASAVYGSDAMAGVVNVILKKSYVGTQVSAEGGTTTEGGGTTYHASVISGIGKYDEDGYNAYLNLEYRHQDSIRQVQRAGTGLWSSTDLSSIGGVNLTPGVINQFVPKAVTLGTVYITNPNVGGFSNANAYFYNTPIAPNANYNGNCTLTLMQSGGCAYHNDKAEIQPETKNINVIGSFTKKLVDDWKLDIKASLFDSQGQQFSGAGSGGGYFAYPGSFSPNVAVSAGVNPYLVGTTIPLISIPATYPGNPFGVPARVRGVIPDSPNGASEFESKQYRFVADFTGSLGAWDIDTSVGYSRINLTQSSRGENVVALNTALNAPNGSAGQWLITGGNSASLINQIFPNLSSTDTSELSFVEFHASRSLMQLQGGDMGFSTGGSYIHRSLDSPAPDLIAQGIVAGNNAFAKGTQSDTSVYAEVYAPVLKSLEFDGHLRFDHFDTVGNSTTPSVGFKYTPVQQFALRGTYGKGFRAPNQNEAGQSGNAYLASTANDPVLCPGGGTAKGDVISQCGFQPVFQNSSSPSLKSEKSTSETLGVILEPIKGWSTTLDYYTVKIEDQITAGTAPSDWHTAVRGAPVTDTCSDGAGSTYTCSASELIYLPVAYVNANSVKVSGFEFDTTYKFKLGEYGSLKADLNWSHTISYVLTADYVGNGYVSPYQLAGTHGPLVIGGDTGNPKDRIQATLGWDSGPLNVTTTFNWIGSFDLTDPSVAQNTCDDGVENGGGFRPWFPSGGAPSKYCKVQSFLDTDLNVTYKLGKNWTLHGAVTNLFNQAPPLDLATYGGGNLPYNPSMHQAGAVGRFWNIGAVYKF